MTERESAPAPIRLNAVQWLICVVSAIGFAFDIYSVLVAPLIIPPALREFHILPAEVRPVATKTGAPATAQKGDAAKKAAPAQKGPPPHDPVREAQERRANLWQGLLFWVPAMAGGVFGLIGGYLTDVLGRRRVLVWSILIYAVSAFATGFATSVEMLLVLRSLTFIGVCVEFVAAVAWLAELFPNPRQREAVLGWTQAFSSLGGVLAAGAYYFAVTYSNSLPAILGGHEPWRYTVISGVFPAIPLMIIRPFLPESPMWAEKKRLGTLGRPSFAELFRPAFRKTTIVTSLMFACSYGAAFGAIQQLPRIVPGLEEVRSLPRQQQQQTVGSVQSMQEFGGLVGRALLALLAVYIVRRRTVLRIFQIPGLFIVPLVFFYPAIHDLGMLKIGIFLAGFFTVAQFSFWGNYLPRVYPTRLRGTGESFAANIGGRMLGTGFAFVTLQLANVMPGVTAPMRLAYSAAAVALFVYLAGTILSFFLPEPAEEKLPE